ncbi:MAG: hypothetical protein AMXMBFR84_45410 [Candidatus Hydrogenedentota bacterium]
MSEGNGNPRLRRTITLWGALAFVVGAVIGAGIFVLIAPIAEGAGAAIWLAFLIAMFVSLAGTIPIIQLAGAIPRAGAGFFFASRLLGPMAGVVTSALFVLAGVLATCVVALGLAEYTLNYISLPLGVHLTGGVILIIFFGLYHLGMRFAIGLQAIMALQLIGALLLYGVVGFLHADVAISLSPPRGWGAFAMAVLLCYNTCLGFQVLAELGEEVHHAKRTIPLALLLGGAIVGGLYILVAVTFVSLVPYDASLYESLTAPLDYTSRMFLSSPLATFVGIGAIAAGVTSLNAAAVALPREFFSAARDGMLPDWFQRIDRRTHSPMNAVLAFFAASLAVLLLRVDLETYGLGAALGIQSSTAIVAIASLRLRRLFPDEYATAYIRFPRPLLWGCAGFTLLASVGFVGVVAMEKPGLLMAYGAVAAASIGYYLVRTRRMTQAGVAWRDTLKRIPVCDDE